MSDAWKGERDMGDEHGHLLLGSRALLQYCIASYTSTQPILGVHWQAGREI